MFKACVVEGLAAEGFLHADDSIIIILSILYNAFMNDVYLPDTFTKSAIAPIINTKPGVSSDINNYRLIFLIMCH